jgi:nucleotide-binding universal stress UspA family protein
MAENAQTFLVVVDETPESRKAIRFAALRALHTGATVSLLHVLKPTQFLQWGGVQKAMDAEAEQEAEALMAGTAAEVEQMLGKRPQVHIRRGKAPEEVLQLVTEDRSIRGLVLAAAARGKPGPLVDFFSGERAGSMPCLVMIVPGGMSEEDLDRLT